MERERAERWRTDIRQRTSREKPTVNSRSSELAELRDDEVPYLLNMFYRRETLSARVRQPQLSRMRAASQDLVRGIENNRKRYEGYLAALLDPEI